MSITWGELNNKLIAQAKRKRIPISGGFELTSRCNLRCKMCYVSQPANDKDGLTKELSLKEWVKLAEEARDAGLLYLLLTGGEVFLRKDFIEIYEELSSMGFAIQIFTNATLITPDIAKWLGRIPPLKVGVTVYGSSPETYAKVCGDGSGFERAMRGIDLLLAEGINLQLRTTIIRDNADNLENLAEIAIKKRVEFGIVNYIFPRREGNRTCPENERLSPLETAELGIYIERHLGNKFKDTSDKIYKKPTSDENNLNNSNKSESIDAFLCTAGKSGFWITWDGRMTPCGSFDKPFTLPLNEGFNTAWKELQDTCSSISRCQECMKCNIKEYCIACPVKLYKETGSFDKPASYLCELAKNKKALKDRLHHKGGDINEEIC